MSGAVECTSSARMGCLIYGLGLAKDEDAWTQRKVPRGHLVVVAILVLRSDDLQLLGVEWVPKIHIIPQYGF